MFCQNIFKTSIPYLFTSKELRLKLRHRTFYLLIKDESGFLALEVLSFSSHLTFTINLKKYCKPSTEKLISKLLYWKSNIKKLISKDQKSNTLNYLGVFRRRRFFFCVPAQPIHGDPTVPRSHFRIGLRDSFISMQFCRHEPGGIVLTLSHDSDQRLLHLARQQHQQQP